MKSGTLAAIAAIIRNDPPETAIEHRRLAGVLGVAAEARPQVISRGEAAKILNCSVVAVDQLDRQGVIKKVKWPDRERARGFLMADVEKLAVTR